MKILYLNHVMSSTITSSSEDPYYSWDEALNDARLTRVGRTLDDTSEWIQFTNDAAVDVDYAYVSNANIQSGATVKIQGNATDVWTSPSVSEDLVYNSSNNYWIYNFASTESYQYWRLLIEDPTNPDGYIEIAYVYIGDELVMPGVNPDAQLPYTSNAQVSKSISGQAYGDRRVRLKGGRLVAPIADETQRQEINTFFDYVDLTVPFLVLLWENSLDVEPPLYAQLTNSLEWAKNPHTGITWTIQLEFEEVR